MSAKTSHDEAEALDTYEQEFERMALAASAQVTSDAVTTQPWAARLVDPPPVSCLCPTYGRVELLEEAIQSFLLQDYPGKKELIVLNDCAEQTLRFDHPEVRVINAPGRFASVGEKYNAAAAQCAHDLLFVWHDDDIYLPHRLSLSVARMERRVGFFKAAYAWFWNDGRLSGPDENSFHGGSCFSRELLAQARGTHRRAPPMTPSSSSVASVPAAASRSRVAWRPRTSITSTVGVAPAPITSASPAMKARSTSASRRRSRGAPRRAGSRWARSSSTPAGGPTTRRWCALS